MLKRIKLIKDKFQKLTGRKTMKRKKYPILDEIKKGFEVVKENERERKRREIIENIYKIAIFIVVFSFYVLIMHQLLGLLPREMNIFSSIVFSFLNLWFAYLVLHFSGINTD